MTNGAILLLIPFTVFIYLYGYRNGWRERGEALEERSRLAPPRGPLPKVREMRRRLTETERGAWHAKGGAKCRV